MDRAELERLDREGLVMRAQAAGIRRARVLTRPELIDELLRLDPSIDQTQLKKHRGFFGVARDLLSRVVERGLHLPDAAERLRAALGNTLPQVPRPEPQAVPTVTLAEIYAAQGHKLRAVETLQRVLEAEPEHVAARVLLEKLEASGYVPPSPSLPPELEEAGDEIGSRLGASEEAPAASSEVTKALVEEAPTSSEVAPSTGEVAAKDHLASALSEFEELASALSDSEQDATASALLADLSEAPSSAPCRSSLRSLRSPPSLSEQEAITLPHASTRTECVAVPLEGGGFYVWWRLSPDARRTTNESSFVVRAVVLVPGWDGPQREIRDVACDPGAGELVLDDLADNAVVRVAVGVMVERNLVPLAHSPALERGTAPGLLEWTLEGTSPIALEDPKAAAIARALEGAARAALRQSSNAT